MKRSIVWLVLASMLSGCLATYRDFPMDALEHPPATKPSSTLFYNVKKFDVLDAGGYSKLRSLFGTSGVFGETEEVSTTPSEGLYVEVETSWKPLSLPALIFGYISVSTLTLLPAWSTKDGYVVRYHLYQDGQEQQVFSYEITRKAGVWLVLLPVAWLNLATYSEEDAFEATALQFLRDAAPRLSSARTDWQQDVASPRLVPAGAQPLGVL